MATRHGNASAQHVHLDCEGEKGAKRLKVDPAYLVTQAGNGKESGEGIALECVKQEPGEEQWQGCEARRQPIPKTVETPRSEQGCSGHQGQAGGFCPPADASQQLQGHQAPQLLFGITKVPQSATLAPGKIVCKIVKNEFPSEVGREEIILDEDTPAWDSERQKFREFCYYEAVGPRLTFYRLCTLCRQWLQPDKRNKKQILEQIILEQFLAILPREMQSYVRAHHPDSCPRAVALAEGFLLLQEQKVQEALQKVVVYVSKPEEPLLDSCQQQPLSREIKQEDDSDPSTPAGGTVTEIKEETLSQEDSPMETPATTEGCAPRSIPSPGESGLVSVPKEDPETTCNPGGETLRKIKEENLSEEDSLLEAPAPAGGRTQQSIAFPSGLALVGFPKEEPGSPCSGTVGKIKEETLSKEDSLVDAPETAEGRAQQAIAFPSGSVLVGLPKEEPGTAGNPGSAPCKVPAVKLEEKPGKSGEPEAQGLALGREEENTESSGQELAGEREEVWTGYGKTFRWKSVLTPCKETGTDWKIYQCCACGKNCDAKSIIAHQKIHTGERLYECIYCGRTFSQRSHFEAHEKIHTAVKVQTTRENMYICATCGKSFAYYSTLVAHKRSHGEDDTSMTD